MPHLAERLVSPAIEENEQGGSINNEWLQVSVDSGDGILDSGLYCFDTYFDNEFDSSEFTQLTRYMHPNDIQEITSPPTENWATADPCMLRTKFDINTSLEKNWEMALDEAREVKSRLLNILSKDTADDITIEMIIMHFIGPASNVGQVIRDAAKIDNRKYTEFMSAFFIQAAYRISSTQLFASYSLLKEQLLISEQEYNGIWKTIAYKNQKLGSEIGVCRRSESLWETLEYVVNRELRNVSIAERRGKMSIALDDDKVWYNTLIRWMSDTFGIKITRHVKDNRIGMILHTAVSSGLNIPVGCTFERINESTKKCYKRMFGQMFGSYGGIDLRNVNVHSDRGYNLPSIVFDFLVANGANVVGTTKRMSQCWPFTFNQKVKQSDKRTHIDSKGAPTLYMKQATVGPGKKVWAAAFRNGSEAVSTAVSSLHSGFQWEGVSLNQSLALNYSANPWTLRGMFFASCGQDVGINLCINDNEDENAHLVEYYLSQKIDPVTLSQGTADWHYLRKFSLTSSQAHGCFIAAFPFFKHSEAWKSIAQYIYGDKYETVLLRTNDSEVSHGGAGEEECERNGDCNSMKSILTFLQDFVPANDNENHALAWLMEYVETDVTVDGDQRAKDILATTATNERSRARFINCVISILLNRIPVEKRAKSGQKQLLIWLQSKNAEREYLFMKADALREILNQKGKKCVGNKISDMIKALSSETTDTTYSDIQSNTISLSLEHLAIKAMLEKSFQKPLKGKLREYCSQGHKLEKPILQNWLNLKYDRYFPLPSLEVANAYVTGLAAKKSRPYAKDSVDFHLHVKATPDSPLVAWGFEAKGRVTVSSAFQEEDYNSNMVRDQHIMIKDNEVSANLASASERFQVLHHAYVYDYGAVVHAVGDAQGEIIQSTIIEFTEHTKRQYDVVVSDLFSLTLDWIYSAIKSPVEIPDHFRDIITHIPTINGWDTLQCTANLWKEMTLQPLPMPPLERIIPSIHAYWNTVKSGSDTTTKLLDSCLVLMPHTTCESVASTRLIGLILVLIHRVIQLFTSKSDPSIYPSLMHYRNAASKRYTFHHTLLECHKVFSNYIKTKSATPASEGISSSIQHPRPIRRKEAGVSLQRITNMANCSMLPPYDTPKRLPSKLRNGTAPEQYLTMNESCAGIPMKCFSTESHKQYQARCNYPGCTSKTSWYCHGCKQWLCMERKKKSDMKDVPHFSLGIKQVQGKQMIFQMTCFHLKHQEVWKPDTRNNTTTEVD